MPNKPERILQEIQAINREGYDIVDSVVASYRGKPEVGPKFSLSFPGSWKDVLQLETDGEALTDYGRGVRNPRRIPTIIPLGTGAMTEAPPDYGIYVGRVYYSEKPKERPVLGRPAVFLELSNVNLNLRRSVAHEQYGKGSVLSLAFLPQSEWSLDKSNLELPLDTPAGTEFLKEVAAVLSSDGLKFIDQKTKDARARLVEEGLYSEVARNFVRKEYPYSPLKNYS